MATTVPSGNLISMSRAGTAAPVLCARPVSPRRRVSPEAGRAIEILGHAIEYLADEFALDCMENESEAWIAGTHRGSHPQLQAIELLKARNREIYLSCPVIPSIAERLRAWLRWHRI